MNDQCHDCKIRKLCYLEEPEEDWTCDHYEPCEYDEEDDPDINVGDKDTISRAKAIDAVKRLSLGETDAMRLAMRIGDYLERLSPAQLGANLAEVGTDCISRQAAIDRLTEYGNGRAVFISVGEAIIRIEQLPPAQPEIVRCKDCKYWNSGSCEYPEHAVNCQDYWVGDIETEAEHFCGYAKRREVTA